jgi:hypothetical protein
MSHAEHLVNQFLQDKGYALGTDYVQQIKFDDLIGVGQKSYHMISAYMIVKRLSIY